MQKIAPGFVKNEKKKNLNSQSSSKKQKTSHIDNQNSDLYFTDRPDLFNTNKPL